jgi:hypothetical protein
MTGAVDRRPVADDPATAFERLLAGEDRQTWSVVSRLDASTMPVWFGKLRELQKSTPRESAEWQWLVEIESALYFHWADADPEAAWADVSDIPKSNDFRERNRTKSLVRSVLAAWMRKSPDEAFTATKDHPDHGYIARDMLIMTWTPETLEESLAKHPGERRDLLGSFCSSIIGDDAKREKTIEFLLQKPAPKDADWGQMRLFRAWGYTDFSAAMARVEEMELPDMVQLIYQDNLTMTPAESMPWAIARGLKPGGPVWEEGYQQWLIADAGGARAWFATQAPAWERDGRDSAVAGFLASELANAMKPHPRNFKATASNPTGVVEADVKAAAERLSGFLARWSAKDAAAESKWRNAASKEMRDRLTETETSR